MGDFTEASTFDAAIHEIATTDAVLGGDGAPLNTSLQSLTNRTRYLLDGLNALMASAAPINAPNLTGNARAPTATTGDSSTKIATTAFVNTIARGVISVDVSAGGSIVLTAAQFGCGIILLTGALAADATVIVPNSGFWVFCNNTTNNHSVAVKTAAGTGTPVTQGKSMSIIGDGVNASPAFTDVASLNLPSNNLLSGAYTAKQSDIGSTFQIVSVGAMTVTLNAASLQAGWYATFVVTTQSILTLSTGAQSLDGTVGGRTGTGGTAVTVYFNGAVFTTISGVWLATMSFAGWSNGAVSSQSHSLGVLSRHILYVRARCTSAEGGYSVSDDIVVTGQITAMVNSTTAKVAVPAAGITMLRGDTAAAFTLTPSKWSLTMLIQTH